MNVTSNARLYDGCVFLSGYPSSSRDELIKKLSSNVPYFEKGNLAMRKSTDRALKFRINIASTREELCRPVSKMNVFVMPPSFLLMSSTITDIYKEANCNPESFILLVDGKIPSEVEEKFATLKSSLLKKGCQIYDSIDEVAKLINEAYLS